jgi:hypothetical protein
MNLLNLLPIRENLQAFFGWASLLCIGYLILASLFLIALRRPVGRLHAKLFGVEVESLPMEYFRFMANFKVASIILFIIPYLSLKFLS